MTNRKQAEILLNEITRNGTSQGMLLDWILSNYLDGSQVVEALELFKMENDFIEDEDVVEEEDDHYNDVFYDKEEDVELDD